MAMIIVSAIISAITAKIVATYYFTLYIQNRSVMSKTQEKAFDKVVKIL